MRVFSQKASATLLLAATLMGCHRAPEVAAPVLTLMPAAFEGGSWRGDELCLAAGQEATAPVWVHENTVTFTWRGRTARDAVLAVALGSEVVATESLAEEGPVERTYRASPTRGTQLLRLRRPAGTPGEVCVSQVALTQP